MSKEKPRKRNPAERNQVMWADKNFKFIREHSIAYPEPTKSAWQITRKKSTIIILALLFAALLIFISFEFTMIPITLAWVALNILLLVEICKKEMRTRKFYKDLINRGGEIIDPSNINMINKNTTSNRITWAIFLLIICSYLGVAIYLVIIGLVPPFYFYYLFYYPSFYYFSFNNMSVTPIPCPIIFMDIDEGLLFGNALFSYDILSGIRPTGKGNGFELYYEGKKVAWGNMLPADMNHLLEMIEIHEKYSDYLL